MRKTLDETDKQKLYRISWSAYWLLIILINLDIMYRMYSGQTIPELYDLFIINFIGIFGMTIIMSYFFNKKAR